MTAAERPEGAHSIGWLTSLSLHATLILGALLITQRLSLAPQPAPFTWNVALIAAASLQASDAPPTPAHISTTTASLRAPLPRTSATAESNAVFADAKTVETAPAVHDEPVAPNNQASAITDISTPVATHELQRAVDQEFASTQSGVISESPIRQPESPSELLSTPVSREDEAGLSAQTASFAPAVSPVTRLDYAWLSETIMRRMHELKRYPAEARLDRAEGKVVLKAVIRNNGSIEAVEVFQSSGHQSLDRAAVELLTLAAPFRFPRPLDKRQITVKIPMNYRLE